MQKYEHMRTTDLYVFLAAGDDGWELISAAPEHGSGGRLQYFFKRPVEEQTTKEPVVTKKYPPFFIPGDVVALSDPSNEDHLAVVIRRGHPFMGKDHYDIVITNHEANRHYGLLKGCFYENMTLVVSSYDRAVS